MSIGQLLTRVMPLPLLTKCRSAKLALIDWRHSKQESVSVFARIHDLNEWGSMSSVSGPGSEARETEDVRALIPLLLQRFKVASMLDAPCGDFSWMSQIDLGECEYTGVEVVPALVEKNQAKYEGPGRTFIHADLTKDPLPRADLILCRDCLIHLSFKDALAVLRNFHDSAARYLLVTTNPTIQANRPIQTGAFRPVNMELPPFNLPAPLEIHRDRYEVGDGNKLLDPDKKLGLFYLPDVRLPR